MMVVLPRNKQMNKNNDKSKNKALII